MEIHEITNLDCNIKENRMKLAKEVSTLFGRDSALSLDQIKKAAEKVSDKYGIYIQMIMQTGGKGKYTVSVCVGHGYSMYNCTKTYEIYAKFILIAHEHYRIRKMEAK